jgi:hypothetical protein
MTRPDVSLLGLLGKVFSPARITASLVVLLIVCGHGVYAADGTAEFTSAATGPTLLYHLELSGQQLEGRCWPIEHVEGTASRPQAQSRGVVEVGNSDVRIQKAAGVWSGWFANFHVTEATAKATNDNTASVVIVSPEFGRLRFMVTTTKDGEVQTREVSQLSEDFGHVHPVGRLSAERTSLSLGNTVELTSEEGTHYYGPTTALYQGYGLETQGALAPATLAREDPVLYVLLYFVAMGGLAL